MRFTNSIYWSSSCFLISDAVFLVVWMRLNTRGKEVNLVLLGMDATNSLEGVEDV